MICTLGWYQLYFHEYMITAGYLILVHHYHIKKLSGNMISADISLPISAGVYLRSCQNSRHMPHIILWRCNNLQLPLHILILFHSSPNSMSRIFLKRGQFQGLRHLKLFIALSWILNSSHIELSQPPHRWIHSWRVDPAPSLFSMQRHCTNG